MYIVFGHQKFSPETLDVFCEIINWGIVANSNYAEYDILNSSLVALLGHLLLLYVQAP